MAIRHSLEIGDGIRTKTVALLSNNSIEFYIQYFFLHVSVLDQEEDFSVTYIDYRVFISA